ncbi:MAG: hypothetical protein Q9184_005514 [Pyrenodesmia sp. 2 TL-2023]
MAPILQILFQWLPSLPSTSGTPSQVESIQLQPSLSQADQPQQPIPAPHTRYGKIHIMGTDDDPDLLQSELSSVSWSPNHLDIFGYKGGNLTHKYWDGHQWNPAGLELETLGSGLATHPVAYWDGTAWKPNAAEFEEPGGYCEPGSTLAVTTWGLGRLDVFCRVSQGEVGHQYYDGSEWSNPIGLGGEIKEGPYAVSWGEDRLDIFYVNLENDIDHLSWDGSSLPDDFETFKKPEGAGVLDSLTVTSWGKDRLDIFTTERHFGLWHIYWDGSQWVGWERLSESDDEESVSGVDVASWAANRFDVVSRRRYAGNYRYKYYDGESWQPSILGWYDRGPNLTFDSEPSVVSWAPNRIDIFGQTPYDEWCHQAWTGSEWYPGSTEWEYLNGRYEEKSPSGGRTAVEIELRYRSSNTWVKPHSVRAWNSHQSFLERPLTAFLSPVLPKISERVLIVAGSAHIASALETSSVWIPDATQFPVVPSQQTVPFGGNCVVTISWVASSATMPSPLKQHARLTYVQLHGQLRLASMVSEGVFAGAATGTVSLAGISIVPPAPSRQRPRQVPTLMVVATAAMMDPALGK